MANAEQDDTHHLPFVNIHEPEERVVTLAQIAETCGATELELSELIRTGKVLDVTELQTNYSVLDAREIICTLIDEEAPIACRL